MIDRSLRRISLSDQAFPCSLVHNWNGEPCTVRATFRIYPTCSHTEDTWPTAQSCAAHLAHVVRLASKLCVSHSGSDTVRVTPLAARGWRP